MNRLRTWRVPQTSQILILSLSFLLGVALAKTGLLVGWTWPILLGGLALSSWRRRTIWSAVLIIAVGLSLGWWRGSTYQLKLADYDHYFGHKITILAVASNDATYNSHQQLSFDATDVVVAADGHRLTGKVALSGFGANAVFAGDTVAVTGKLRPGYGSAQAQLSYGQLAIQAHGDSLVAELRRRFVAGMQSALPEPLASFGMGLLIGQKATLPDAVYQSLLMVGLVHIIAVSGYNLTIILRATDGMLKRHSKRLSLLLSLGLIGLFLLVAGASASIVRAAIISVLSLLAAYYGRQTKPLVLLLLAAAISGWFNPFYLWTDVSWYLSFLAFFGVLVVAPLIQARLPQRLRTSLLMAVAVETLCAELLTIPYVLFIFGQLSVAGLLANVVVATLVPLAMLLCLVAGLAGMIVAPLAGWLSWPARFVLTYMLDTAQLLSRIPHIFIEHIHIVAVQLTLLYGAVAFVVVVLWRKTKPRLSATITDEKAVMATANQKGTE